ncbi:hypothetical protein CBOM_02178 [Ceraceosorus bombacis]|uniref:Uncharacterized protein n=1 Tax=Ceraceosorus bombacis TaxID=401625 RepID=A0A0P1BDW8_9BASI|nr:hypothetical protein CBOM_02178 [Ceraceosorus bombacis]
MASTSAQASKSAGPSEPAPDQDLSNKTLYVPLRTDEIGWEEGGLIWGGRRPVYAYPTVNLYGGDDDHIIGTYRGGPKGYSFYSITDSKFSVASSEDCEERPPGRKAPTERPPRRETGDEIESDPGSPTSRTSTGHSSSSSSASTSRSDSTGATSSSSCKSATAAPPTPIKTTCVETCAGPSASTSVLEGAAQTSSPVATDGADELLQGASTPSSSSAASSRRSSSSADASGVDTGATTPVADVEQAAFTEDDLSERLKTKLASLQTSDDSDGPRPTRKLARRAGSLDLSTAQEERQALTKGARAGRSISLDLRSPGAERCWPAGRGTSGYDASGVAGLEMSSGSFYEDHC